MPSEIIRERLAYRVQTKAAWSDTWVDSPYLECLSVSVTAAPSISQARFRYRAGLIKREDSNEFQSYAPLNVDGHYVAVWIYGDDLAGERRVFVGRFIAETAALHGSRGGTVHITADQEFVATGLENELTLVQIHGSWVVNSDGEAIQIDTPIPVNGRFGRGYQDNGNRSHEKKVVGTSKDEDAPTTYVFAGRGSGPLAPPDVWTIGDVLDYVLQRYFSVDAPFPVSLLVHETLNATLATEAPYMALEGRTVHEVLNALLDHRRGLGWYLRVAVNEEGDDIVQIVIFSVLGQGLSVGDYTLPPNNDIRDLQLEAHGDHDASLPDLTECLFDANNLTRYGTIIIQGAPVLTCFTMRVGEGQILEPAWTADDSTPYDFAGAMPTGRLPEEYDEFRAGDQFEYVYRAFRVRTNWDWTVIEGDNTEIANPRANDDATIDPGQSGAIRDWGLRFCRQLPLQNTATLRNPWPDFQPLLALLKNPETGRHAPVDSLEGLHGVRPLDNDLGVQIGTRPGGNHILAKGHFDASNASTTRPSAITPVYNYEELVVTAAVRLDERIKCVQTVDGGEPHKVLYVDQPDAELWYIVPGTITGVDKDGTFVRHEGGLVRDDGEQLRRLAAFYKAWYSVRRTSVTLRGDAIWVSLGPGTYIRQGKQQAVTIDINSVVTEVAFDLSDNMPHTTIRTQWAELELPRNRPRITVR